MKLSGFVDGSTLESDLHLSPDVCIVGSGAGGAVAADVLSAAGLEVLVLEAGGHYTKRDFDMREDTAYAHLYQEDGGRSTEDLSVAILQGRGVGGSTTINWTTCFRTPEDVVEHWRKEHGVRGFSHSELVPHWEAIEKRLGIAEVAPGQVNRNNQLLLDGCRALGWDATLLRRNVRGCLSSGYCGMGCPVDAKQSMLVSLLPDAVRRGAVVLSRCRADRFVFSSGKATALEATLLKGDDVTPTGRRVRIEARRFIVSGGGINSPALLLRSGFSANERVGTRTFLHPTVAQLGVYDEPVNPFYGAPQSVASHEFSHREDGIGFMLETAPGHPMLAALTAPGIGKDHAEALRALPYVAAHIGLVIDGFHPSESGGRVKLRKSGAPVLDYVLPERVWEGIRAACKAMARVQLASGARESRTVHDPPCVVTRDSEVDRIDGFPFRPNSIAVSSAHVMGGLRLGDDPTQGLVSSEDMRLHGTENIHVIDGSLFPTSLGVNPQLSIYGLARLASTRLAGLWRQ